MSQIKSSALLTLLLNDCKRIGVTADNEPTAERFVVSVIDVMLGNVIIHDKAAFFPTLDIMNRLSVDYGKVRDDLVGYIESSAVRETDVMYLAAKMQNAVDKTVASGGNELMCEDVLINILDDPTNAIRNCFVKNVRTGADNAVAGASRTQTKDNIATEVKDTHTGKEGKAQIVIEGDIDKAEKTAVQNSESTKKTGTKCESTKAKDPRTSVAVLTSKVKKMGAILSESVFGQDNAISVFITGYFRSELLDFTDKNRVRPKATYLFAGPPGVGKTFLAEKVAQILELPFMRFDMSEYVDDESNIEFCGSDKVYKNGKAGNLTSFVEQNPRCVLLFDEIEKAHISIIHLFLQLLDAGRLRDNFTDNEVSFKDAIIIFTTNAGKQLYENSDGTDLSGISRKVILKALRSDINPVTKQQYFPSAICSRFASGNVVMFNHISASDLRRIAKREILRHASSYENEIGVKVEIDPRVYSAILFAEGGHADARTVRSRAEAFFDDELYELFRLTASDRIPSSVADIEKISFELELPSDNSDIRGLFENIKMPKVLVFSDEDSVALCKKKCTGCEFVGAQSIEKAKSILKKEDMSLVLLDYMYAEKGAQEDYLNIEDVESAGREFFKFVREYYADMPIYLLAQSREIGDEERVSFMRQGVRDVILLDGKFEVEMISVCSILHQQRCMSELAKSNRIVSFETAQMLLDCGKQATIKLFDFKSQPAFDADDSENVLSNVSKPNVRFDEVIGADDAKEELRYFAEYLKNPKKYIGTGVRAPKGVLLYGPPGTGKTLLAKAMASESDATFITAEGNQFLKKYVGEGSEQVHKLFATARKYAPSILFIDEIDAIGKERRGGDGSVGAEQTLTAFLAEMDGFNTDPTKPVFVLAATNFDVEAGRDKSLDGALIRRFDRKVYIDLPGKDDRVRFMELKISKNSVFEIGEDKISNIAVRSTGMSLAELDSVFELALRSAIRRGSVVVTDDIFDEAFETFNSGEKKEWDISLLERVARHEAGHAFICWQGGEIPSYLTIVARADHGGYMQHGDNEGKAIHTKEELLCRIRTSLGGRAAELVYYGADDGMSSGVGADLRNATNTAQRMICRYGMDESFGLASIDIQSGYSGALADDIRDAVNSILSEQLDVAVALIEKNKIAVDALVDVLISKNHLTGDEIDEILKKYAKI